MMNVKEQKTESKIAQVKKEALAPSPIQTLALNSTDANKYTTVEEVQNIILASYPVGSIYISTNSTNPSSYLGGTWESYAEGRTLVGIDVTNEAFNTVEKLGGSSTNILTTDNLPPHTHGLSSGVISTKTLIGSFWNVVYQDATYLGSATGIVSRGKGSKESAGIKGTGTVYNVDEGFTINATHNHTLTGNTQATGSGSKINNLQPYITVYIWKRIN